MQHYRPFFATSDTPRSAPPHRSASTPLPARLPSPAPRQRRSPPRRSYQMFPRAAQVLQNVAPLVHKLLLCPTQLDFVDRCLPAPRRTCTQLCCCFHYVVFIQLRSKHRWWPCIKGYDTFRGTRRDTPAVHGPGSTSSWHSTPTKFLLQHCCVYGVLILHPDNFPFNQRHVSGRLNLILFRRSTVRTSPLGCRFGRCGLFFVSLG